MTFWGFDGSAAQCSLAKTHRVIVPDLRGSGQSTRYRNPSQYGLHMVRDVVGLLDSLRVSGVHVIGYSMGSLIAAHLALQDKRVLSAALEAGVYHRDSAEAAREFEPFATDIALGRRLGPFLQMIVPAMSSSDAAAIDDELMTFNDRDALVASLRSFSAMSIDWTAVASSRVPMVAVVGTRDPFRSHSQRIVQRWPNSRLVEAPDGDHINITYLPVMLDAFRSLGRTRAS